MDYTWVIVCFILGFAIGVYAYHDVITGQLRYCKTYQEVINCLVKYKHITVKEEGHDNSKSKE